MGELTSIDSISDHLLTIGERSIQRKPDAPEPAPRVCSVCGQEVPALLTIVGKWMDRQCACERARKYEAEEKRNRKELMKAMAEHTYDGWLGKEWINPQLVRERASKRFEQYDTERSAEYEQLRTAYTRLTGDAKSALQARLEEFERGRASWRKALIQAQAFAHNPQGVLLLHGQYGVGKSHLLAAVCNTLRHREQPVSSLFVVVPRFFQAIYDKMGTGAQWEIIRRAVGTRLLVIDDVDKSPPKDFRQEILFQMIDERVNARLPIAVSTNKMSCLSDYIGEAACSRLMQGCVSIEMSGKDYRLNMVEHK